jgi:hypothetical protein
MIALALIAAFASNVRAGEFMFGASVDTRFSDSPYGVATGDFNEDGRDDLAVLVGGRLEVFLQQDTGALAATLQLEIPSVAFAVVQAADLGADGSTEILVGHDSGMAVYAWNGAGGFTLENHAAQSSCDFLATADLDSDGAPDVFCHGRLGDGALYYSGLGHALKSPIYMQTPAYMPNPVDGVTVMQIQLKDVTGDGKPDLLMAPSTYNSFFVYASDGVRGFLPATAYPYPEENDMGSVSIEAMDVDGDDANEVIVAKNCNRPCSAILIYKRGDHGYLTLSKRLQTYDNPSVLLASDIDRDGRQDLLVGHSGWFAVGRYMGQGQKLSDVERLSLNVPTFAGANRYALGDLDHDGFTDLVVANLGGISLRYGRRRAGSDFDGDGISDLLWRHATGKNVVWRSAGVTTQAPMETVDPAWSIQGTGDFDGDGTSEVFWRNHETGANNIRSANYGMETTGVTSQDWQVVGVGDFDGDDRADLFWRNLRTGANTIWKSGDSTTLQATNGVTDLRWKVVGVGDFDGDGRSDILWRHSASGANVIWRGGQRAEQQAVAGVTNLAWKVAGVGDFNGDGKDDVAWRNVSTGANAIWRSANTATKQAVTGVSNPLWAIAAVGDYNGDGRSDLMWRNTTSGTDVIWRSANARQQQSVATVRDLRWKIVP